MNEEISLVLQARFQREKYTKISTTITLSVACTRSLFLLHRLVKFM